MGNACSCVDQSKSFSKDEAEIVQADSMREQTHEEQENFTFKIAQNEEVIDGKLEHLPRSELARQMERKLGAYSFNADDNCPTDLFGPVKMPNGGLYIGQFNPAGKKSGRGIYIWQDGAKYIGY